jgi:hypothetical protein
MLSFLHEKNNHCKNIEIAEATADLLGLQSVIYNPNYSGPILVENDCATLISEVKIVEKSKSAIANIVDVIKKIITVVPRFCFVSCVGKC